MLAGEADLTLRRTSLLTATAVQNQQVLTDFESVPMFKTPESTPWPPSGALAAMQPATIASQGSVLPAGAPGP